MNGKINNILFIEVKSPFHHIFSRTTIPRLGSVLLATILKNNGYNTRVVIEDVKQFSLSMLRDIDLVAISTITSTAPRAYEIADKCRKGGIKVVMGGPHVTFLPDEALEHCEYVIRGEGEIPITQLMDALNAGKPLCEIKGLSYKDAGAVFHNEKGDFIRELDSLPIPDFSLIDGWTTEQVTPFATSRGCPFKCKFCSVIKMFGTSMRFLSVDRVIEELKIYVKNSRHVFFCDDNFTANKSRAKQIMRRMIKDNIKVQWSAQVRVDAAKDVELLRLMKKTNCFAVFIGFESINPKTLIAFDKRQSVDDIKHSIKMFHKFNINIHGMFVLGGPDDNVFTIRNTAKFAKSTRIDSVQFMMLTPLPGTETYYELEQSGALLTKDWKLYDSHHAVFQPENMSAYELQVETLKAMGKFYSWGNIIRHFLNLNFFYFFVNIYGKKSIKKAFRDNVGFIENLKNILNEEAGKVKEYLLPLRRKTKRIVIPENMLSTKERAFLFYFFKDIGIKVQFIKTRIDESDIKGDISKYIISELGNLKIKADFIMMPISEKYSAAYENFIRSSGKDMLNNMKNIKFISLTKMKKNMYNFCLSFGLALNKKRKKINKAYFHAIEKAHLNDVTV